MSAPKLGQQQEAGLGEQVAQFLGVDAVEAAGARGFDQQAAAGAVGGGLHSRAHAFSLVSGAAAAAGVGGWSRTCARTTSRRGRPVTVKQVA